MISYRLISWQKSRLLVRSLSPPSISAVFKAHELQHGFLQCCQLPLSVSPRIIFCLLRLSSGQTIKTPVCLGWGGGGVGRGRPTPQSYQSQRHFHTSRKSRFMESALHFIADLEGQAAFATRYHMETSIGESAQLTSESLWRIKTAFDYQMRQLVPWQENWVKVWMCSVEAVGVTLARCQNSSIAQLCLFHWNAWLNCSSQEYNDLCIFRLNGGVEDYTAVEGKCCCPVGENIIFGLILYRVWWLLDF